jgi:hypothetical protein
MAHSLSALYVVGKGVLMLQAFDAVLNLIVWSVISLIVLSLFVYVCIYIYIYIYTLQVCCTGIQ